MKNYTVGSLSNLITNSEMANGNSDSEESVDLSGEENADLSDEEDADLSGEESPDLSGSQDESGDDDDDDEAPELVKPSKGKKRKLSTQGGEVQSPKKSKNATNGDRKEASEEEQEKPDLELNARTVYVGNIPVTTDSSKLEKFFSQFGIVESVLMRGIPVSSKISKKVAFITKQFTFAFQGFFAFIRFENRDGAVKAAEANGTIYEEHHLKIRLIDFQEKYDEGKVIIVGNLHFLTEDEDLWKTFEVCGPITSVHIVRDATTHLPKGFGYVNFKNSESVTLALKMENVRIHGREVKINIFESDKKGTANKTFHGFKHRQSWEGGPRNFGRSGPRNFERGGPRNFGRGGPRNFGSGGPRSFGGDFLRNPNKPVENQRNEESGSQKTEKFSPKIKSGESNGESGPQKTKKNSPKIKSGESNGKSPQKTKKMSPKIKSGESNGKSPQKTKKMSPKIKSDKSNAETPRNLEGAQSKAKKKTQPNKNLQQKKMKTKQVASK